MVLVNMAVKLRFQEKEGKFLEQPSDYQHFKYDPASVMCFIKPFFPEDFPGCGSIGKNIYIIRN